jgi:hypothetical protein
MDFPEDRPIAPHIDHRTSTVSDPSPRSSMHVLSADGSQSAQYDMSRAGAIRYAPRTRRSSGAISNAARW